MHKPTLLALSLPACAGFAHAQSIESLYKNSCVVCHAADGRGGGAGATTFNTRELFDESHDRPFFDAIKNGLKDNGMPAFGPTLSDAQIWGLVVHIRELQAQALRKQYGSPHPDPQGVYTSQHAKFKLQTLVPKGKLDIPWAIDFFPDSPHNAPDAKFKSPADFIVTERDGNIRLGHADGSLSEPLTGTPPVRPFGQGGMLDVTVHPDFAINGYVYLAFSDPDTPAKKNGMTKIVRGRIDLSDPAHPAWTDQQTIFEAKKEHYLPTAIHFGSRIVFTKPIASGPDQGKRYVFFSIGERGRMEMAQDTTRPNGKIHRLFDDGTVPSDNPFPSGPYPSIWTYGHRNPQALTIDLDGRLWDTEHGPRGGDELNLIDPHGNKNYGWPILCFGINYNGSAFDTPWPDVVTDTKKTDEVKDFVAPVSRWLPSIAVCGLDTMHPGPKGESFPAWRNDLFAGGLAGQTLHRIRIKDNKVAEREELLQGIGRVRDVQTGPDGSLYLVLNEPDEIIRLVPAE